MNIVSLAALSFVALTTTTGFGDDNDPGKVLRCLKQYDAEVFANVGRSELALFEAQRKYYARECEAAEKINVAKVDLRDASEWADIFERRRMLPQAISLVERLEAKAKANRFNLQRRLLRLYAGANLASKGSDLFYRMKPNGPAQAISLATGAAEIVTSIHKAQGADKAIQLLEAAKQALRPDNVSNPELKAKTEDMQKQLTKFEANVRSGD